jgi:D-lactate dehydrogenase
MLSGNYLDLYNRLITLIPKSRIFDDELRTLAYGTDASFYRLIPKLVVKADNEEEIIYIIKNCAQLNIPLTFRAAGTSLSGQAITDSVLVLLSSSWNRYEILDNGNEIKLQPGITGGIANFYLSSYNKKIGPDPASINSAMIGGIAANNASGMCCGTSQNSYKTLAGMKIIFNDGSRLDTNDPASRQEFLKTHQGLILQLERLIAQVKNSSALTELICNKYKMKNTMGYSLNALLDFDDPVDVIQHLMIGSEGTLGFISEITYNTVNEYKDKASSLALFPDPVTAGKAVSILKNCRVDAVELMDRASLRSIENKQGIPEYIKTLDEKASALLIETRAANNNELDEKILEVETALKEIKTILPLKFTKVKSEYESFWNIRKGLFPSVGAMRKTGTTVIIEDVTFPVENLADAIDDLQNTFQRHGYYDAIIFGHALEGNLHFVFKQDFNNEKEVTRYRYFMEDISYLVVKKYQGALKAEHGTGRNMAPFLEYEWGNEAYRVMKEIKNIFDPGNLFNPGVILNNDKYAHIKNLKPLPAADKLIDKCIECGFCEVNCPSKNLTLTPRQRIVAYREISRLKAAGKNPERLKKIYEAFDYQGNQTCAADGLCAISCPVNINTGNLIKELRSEDISHTADGIAWTLANNFGSLTNTLRVSLNIVDYVQSFLGTGLMEKISSSLRKISWNKIPMWNKYIPKGSDKIMATSGISSYPSELKVVYFPSCINRTMGISRGSKEEVSLTTAVMSLLSKAGYQVIFPDNLSDLCCGMPFASKGFKKQGDFKSKELLKEINSASESGKYPVLFDMSPCLYRIKEFMNGKANEYRHLSIYEPVEFILEHLTDKLQFNKQNTTLAIHSTCSSTKMNLQDKLERLARMCAENVIIPKETGCCGWAGDRGFTYPELNASALSNLKREISESCKQGYSTSRTCEIGLSLHSGIVYESIIYLVDNCTSPAAKLRESQIA